MKLLAKYVLMCCLIVIFGLGMKGLAANDLMDTAFDQSRSLGHIINIGLNKNAVGNEVFRGTSDITNSGIVTRAPLLVRITQTLLRITIALSIPVLIWIGVKVISSAFNGGNVKEALKEVSGVLMGLALALSAVGIIWLIQSIATQTFVFN